MICVYVVDRKKYVEQCDSKRPTDVLQALELISSRANIIFADGEGSFISRMLKGFLQANNISISYKYSNDRNVLAIADRAIGLIKRKAAELGDDWNEMIPKAVRSLNSTPKPQVLHGATPNEVKDTPEAHFMLQQDNSDKLKHNQKLQDKRVEALAAAGGRFRTPINYRKQYKIIFEPNFESIALMSEGQPSAGRARALGRTYDIKRIRPATQ